jgi:GNAT superfamily N-acetyltransferase
MFELNEQLIEDISWHMESNFDDFYIDSETGMVCDDGELEEGKKYFDLPEWSSAQGFDLMEDFTAGLKNPPAREKLSYALNRGRGVFRAFKDALEQFPEVEKIWFSYKEKKLKRHVLDWYNALRTEEGLEAIGVEPEETEDLVEEDFVFSLAEKLDTPVIEVYSGEEKAGEIDAHRVGSTWVVEKLFIEQRFRGLGLGERLLQRMITHLHEAIHTDPRAAKAQKLIIDIDKESDGFAHVLAREDFIVVKTRYSKNLN